MPNWWDGLDEEEGASQPAQGFRGAPRRNFVQRFIDDIEDSAETGFIGATARRISDLFDTDRYGRPAPEGMTEEQRDNQLALQTRFKRARMAARDRDDPTFPEGQPAPWDARIGRAAAGLAGNIIGGASPTYLLNPGAGPVTRTIAQAAINTGEDLALQGADILEGNADKLDKTRLTIAAAAGAALQGGIEVGGKISTGRRIARGSKMPGWQEVNDVIVRDLEGGGTLERPKVSPKGAMGPQQVMPETARKPGFGIRPWDGKTQADLARVGRQYSAAMMDKYNGDTAKVLAAYNAGPGRVDGLIKRYGGDWQKHLPAETKAYVSKGLAKLGGDNVVEMHPTSATIAERGAPLIDSYHERYTPYVERPNDPANDAFTEEEFPFGVDFRTDPPTPLTPEGEALLRELAEPPKDVLTPAERQEMDASAERPDIPTTKPAGLGKGSVATTPVNDINWDYGLKVYPSEANAYTIKEKTPTSYYDIQFDTPHGKVSADLYIRNGRGEIDIASNSGFESGLVNKLGPATVRRIAKELIDSIPELKSFAGYRVTGAREASNAAKGRGGPRDVQFSRDVIKRVDRSKPPADPRMPPMDNDGFSRGGPKGGDDTPFDIRRTLATTEETLAQLEAARQSGQMPLTAEQLDATIKGWRKTGLQVIQSREDPELKLETRSNIANIIEELQRIQDELLAKAAPAPKAKSRIVGNLPKKNLAPAIKDKDGNIYVGVEGSAHIDVMHAHEKLWEDMNDDGGGFMTPDGQYLSREEASAWAKMEDDKLSAEFYANRIGDLHPAAQAEKDAWKKVGEAKTQRERNVAMAEADKATQNLRDTIKREAEAASPPQKPPRQPPEEPPEPPRDDGDGGDFDGEEPGKYLGNINTERLDLNQETYAILDEVMAEHQFDHQRYDEMKAAAEKLLKDTPVSDILTADPKLSEAIPYQIAIRTILRDSLGKEVEISRMILDPAQRSDELIGMQNLQRVKTAAAADAASGIAGQAGRLLSSFKINIGDDMMPARAIQEMLKLNPGKMDPESYAEAFLRMWNNEEGRVKLAKDSLNPSMIDIITQMRYSMMLSGIGTHVKNTVETMKVIAQTISENIGAIPVGWVTGSADRVTGMEAAARMYGLYRAALSADTWKNAGQSFMEGTPVNKVSKVEGGEMLVPFPFNLPQRSLAAADSFWRGFIELSDMYGMAARKAHQDGFRGQEKWDETERIAQEAFEKAGELMQARKDLIAKKITKKEFEAKKAALGDYLDIVDHAEHHAEVVQMLSEPSTLTRVIERMKTRKANMHLGQKSIRLIAQMLFPFARVSDRLFFHAIRRSPLFFLDNESMAAIKKGGAERDQVISRVLMGTAAMSFYAMQAWNGERTGEGPRNPQKRKALEAGGWQANSTYDPETGTYRDASAFATEGIPAGMMATLVERYKAGEIGQEGYLTEAGNILRQFLQGFTNNTYLEGGGSLFSGLQDTPLGDTAWSNFWGGMGASFTPAAVRQYNNTADPNVRDTTGDRSFEERVWGRVKAGIPGLSDDLPARSDVYGQLVTKDPDLGTAITGVGKERQAPSDPVMQELQRLERTQNATLVTPVSKSWGKGDNKVTLNAEQFQEYQRLSGQVFIDNMRNEMMSFDWLDMSDDQKKKRVTKVLDASRTEVRELLFPKKEKAPEGNWWEGLE